MTIVLHHHPFTRAANVVWMLEETGVAYELNHVDLMVGAHRRPEHLALNPMGKLPVLTDGEAVVTEAAAIGVYLADRYAPGRLAPALDDPARGSFLRWCFFAPSVIEPGCMAQAAKWEYRPTQAGWGSYEQMLGTIEQAIGDGPWLLGETFTMADVIFGGTVRFMLQFGMIEKRASFEAYAGRLAARPAARTADAKNAAIVAERGLRMPG
jgi:glutathione S-transferase